MPHSYEELRSVALDILSDREKVSYSADQYRHLSIGIAEVLNRREGNSVTQGNNNLDHKDREIFLELFWDLFRQGIITLGLNDSNPNFPFFRVSDLGSRIINNQSGYFFHDVSSYEQIIRKEIPDINNTTMTYLKEAMQAFHAGCILSATVMLGVATEHTFLKLLETIENNPSHQNTYQNVFSQRTVLQKINKFKNILDQNNSSLSSDIKEDLDTNFAGILSLIRNFRNQSGHPSGQIIDREQAFVLLQLFIPYCKKLYLLIDHFK